MSDLTGKVAIVTGGAQGGPRTILVPFLSDFGCNVGFPLGLKGR